MNIKKIFVCHYTKLHDRKISMDKQLKNIDIFHQFITDFDQEMIDEKIYYDNFDEKINFKHSKSIFVSPGSPEMNKTLNKGELSNALKHKNILQIISEESKFDDEDYFLILEDDVIFKKPISKIEDTIIFLKNNSIEHNFIYFGEASLLKDNDEEFCFLKENPSTNGLCTYVINKKSAKILFEDLQKEKISFPMDHEYNYRFFKNNFKVFWATPITKHGSITGHFCSSVR